jgi:hypothetical protein
MEIVLSHEVCFDERNASQVALLGDDRKHKNRVSPWKIKHVPVTSRLPRDFLFVPEDLASCRLISLLDSGVADTVASAFTLDDAVPTVVIKPPVCQSHAY